MSCGSREHCLAGGAHDLIHRSRVEQLSAPGHRYLRDPHSRQTSHEFWCHHERAPTDAQWLSTSRPVNSAVSGNLARSAREACSIGPVIWWSMVRARRWTWEWQGDVAVRGGAGGGVPTIWLGILQLLDAEPGRHELSSLRAIFSGGSTAPPSMIDGYARRHGLNLVHTWGMTELMMGATATLTGELRAAPPDEQHRALLKQGLPMPWSRPGPAARRGWCPETVSHWANWRSAGPGSPGSTSAPPRRALTAGPPTDGSAPATSSPSTRTGTSRSPTGPKTWPSRAASGSPPPRSRERSWPIRPSPRPP
jgi:AMP-binding enzyme